MPATPRLEFLAELIGHGIPLVTRSGLQTTSIDMHGIPPFPTTGQQMLLHDGLQRLGAITVHPAKAMGLAWDGLIARGNLWSEWRVEMQLQTGMGQPMAHYAAATRAGDFVFMSGVVAVDPASRRTVAGYDDIPEHARTTLQALGYATGQMSVDVFEAAIVAQSWFVLERIRQIACEHGGTMQNVVRLVQYLRHLPHYAFYNRVRGLFYPGTPPVSTVVEVSCLLPGDEVLIEVEATMYLPQ